MSEDESLQKYRAQGNKCFRNNNYTEAIQNYIKGLRIDNKNPQLNSNIAQAYLAVFDFVNAEIHARIAIKYCRNSVKGYFRAAKASVGQGNKAKAIKYLKEGIVNCRDMRDLEEYHQKLIKEESLRRMESPEPEEITEDIPELVSDSDSDDTGVLAEKMRSRSTSRVASTSTIDSNKSATANPRSMSMSRTGTTHKVSKKSKKKKGPIEQEDIANDATLLLFERIQKEKGIPRLLPEQIWATRRKELNLLLKEGSEVMASGLSRKAVEKYKTALDMILEHSLEIFKLKEIDVTVLKYALCIGWIELADYGDIAKAIEYLMDIQESRASKFPAVFYGLGSAYYKLNRYKVATEHLEKGLLFLSREVKFEVQSWPGTNSVIPETTRSGLEDVLKELLKTCRTYHEPDAICRYSKCFSLSSHIIPSEHIFFSDPDFCGFVVVICEEKCKIEYHVGCWKDYKEILTSDGFGKLSDKDFIGRLCPTTDCITQLNERSVIVKIEIVGDDTTIKTSIETPKSESTKEVKKSKKKKPEKITDVAPQEKPKSKNRPKLKKPVADTIQPSPQPDIQTSNSAEELEIRLEKLKHLRNINFGFTDNDWNPREVYYGRRDIQELDQFLSPEYIGESDEIKAKKDFIYSYFYEFIKNEGPQKVKDVERKWANESGDFQGISELLNTSGSICMFLLQSYRFASIDDYICLAEQLPDTYYMAKTELVESLSFTLTGPAKSVNPTSNMTNSNIGSEVINESTKEDNINKNEIVNYVEEEPTINQETPDMNISQTNTNNSLTQNEENSHGIIKENDDKNDEDDEDVEDPDIDTSEDHAVKSRSENQIAESSSEYQTGIEDQDITSSETQKIKCDSGEEDINPKLEDEDIKSMSKDQTLNSGAQDDTLKSRSTNISVSESTISEGEKNEVLYYESEENDDVNIEQEEEKLCEINKSRSPYKQLVSDLNPDVDEFKSPEEVVEYKMDKNDASDLLVEEEVDREIPETEAAIMKVDGDLTIPGMPREGSSSLNTDYKKQKWSVFDGSLYTPHLHLSGVMIQRPQPAAPYLGQYMPPPLISATYDVPSPLFPHQLHSGMAHLPLTLRPHQHALPFPIERVIVQPKVCFKSMEYNNTITQTDHNFDDEINNLKSTITKLKQESEENKKIIETTMVSADDQLQEKNKKIQELELELNNMKKKKVEEISSLNKKLKANEVQFKVEKTNLLEELAEAKSETNTNEMIRDLIYTSGQKVKELEDQINHYQQFVLKMLKENVEFRIKMHKQKGLETLGALKRGENYLLHFNSANKTSVMSTISKWETFLSSLLEYEAKFIIEFVSVSKNLAGVTCQDLIIKEWPTPPSEPDCPLNVFEKIACKLLEDSGATGLEMDKNKLKQDAQKSPNDLSVTKNITDKPKTSNIVTEDNILQITNLVNKDNLKIEENLVVFDKDGQEYKIQQKTIDLSDMQNGQAKSAYNPAGVPLFQHPLASTNAEYTYMSSLSPYFYNSQPYFGSSLAPQYGQQIPVQSNQPAKRRPRSHIPILNPQLQNEEIPISKLTESILNVDISKVTSAEQNTQWPVMFQSAKDVVSSTEKDSVNRALLEKKKSPLSSVGLTPIEMKKTGPSSVGSSTVQPTKSVPTIASSSTSVTGANQISKPIAQINIAPVGKSKTGNSYQKLMASLCKKFPTKSEDELDACIAIVREKNNNSLSDIRVSKIIAMIDKELKEKAIKKQGSMGLDKFGGAAWGGVRDSATSWSKPKDSTEEDCVICYEPLDKDQTALPCKHTFHTKCIRKWLHNDSICPMCRVFTRLNDEFPPLN